MIVTLLEIAVWTLLLVGAFFAVVGGIGLLRLPDVFSRMHGSGMTDTLGAGLILTGLAVHSLGSTLLLRAAENPEHGLVLTGIRVFPGSGLVLVKLLAVLFFLAVTSPTATHALSRAALSQGVQPQTDSGKEPPSNT